PLKLAECWPRYCELAGRSNANPTDHTGFSREVVGPTSWLHFMIEKRLARGCSLVLGKGPVYRPTISTNSLRLRQPPLKQKQKRPAAAGRFEFKPNEAFSNYGA